MESAVESIVADGIKQISDKHIDREKICPMLLRVFYNTGRHNNVLEYARGNVPPNELQIHTWMDATLKELTELVKEVNPDARDKRAAFAFSVVTPEQQNFGYRMRQIGLTFSGKKGADDNKTLKQSKFIIGDYLDISITPRNSRRGNFRQY